MIITLMLCGCDGVMSTHTSLVQRQRLWHLLENQPRTEAWKTIFGANGERGEYMDGYSEEAMFNRCIEDYKWSSKFSLDTVLSERAKMV